VKPETASLAILLISSSICDARILNVPQDFQTIQVGIDSSDVGDTILVSPGIYDENLHFAGRSVVVASRYLLDPDPVFIDSTIIDGGARSSVVRFDQGEDSTTALIGFTITNGSGSPDAQGQNAGGGIHCYRSSPYLSNLKVVRNHVTEWGGGIIVQSESSPIITNSVISENTSGYGGGGLYCSRSSSPLVSHVVFTANEGIGSAIGLFMSCRPEIRNCVFSDNVSNDQWYPYLFRLFGYNVLNLTNCVIWQNSSDSIRLTGDPCSNTLNIKYCILQGGISMVSVCDTSTETVNWGEGMLDVDPQFVNAEAGDFRLVEGSPCIDAGDPDDPDPDGTRPELGAYTIVQRSATIKGRVLDHMFGDVIAGAEIAVTREGGEVFRDVTDANGVWGKWTPLWDDTLEVTVTVTHSDYSTWRGVVNVNKDDTVFVQSRLVAGRLTGPAHPPRVSLQEGDSVQTFFEFDNTGNATVNWTAEWRGLGELAALPGEIIQSVHVGAIVHDNRLYGVAFDGECYYLSGVLNDDHSQIYVLDREFRLLRSFIPEGAWRYRMCELEWDGELLWGAIDSVIYGFTPEGELRARLQGPFHPNSNLAFDPVHRTLWVAGTATDIVQMDLEGNMLATLDRKGMRVYGLGWDEFDPGGYRLQILTNPTYRNYVTYKMNVESGDTIRAFGIFDSAGTPMRGLSVIQSRAGRPVGLVIRDVRDSLGGDQLDFIRLRNNREWLTISPQNGSVWAGETGIIELGLKSAGSGGWAFDSGEYQAEISITYNDPDGEIHIPVTLTVTPNSVPGSSEDEPIVTGLSFSAFPNPFNSSTTIRFALSATSASFVVSMAIYSLDGRLIETMNLGRVEADEHSVVWNAEGLPTGVYIARLESGESTRTMKLILMR